jgi:hypothetical protein
MLLCRSGSQDHTGPDRCNRPLAPAATPFDTRLRRGVEPPVLPGNQGGMVRIPDPLPEGVS